MSLRLFAAVRPPAFVLDQLDVVVEPRRSADRNLRWARSDTWHLTLAFFGEVPHGRLDALTEAFDAVRGTPILITLGGSGTFPNPAAARVLYLAVSSGAEQLSALSRRVRTAADRAGVPSDNATHVPHLTLARVRRPADLSRWLRIVDSFPDVTFTVESFALIHSELRPSGPLYRILHTVDLTAREATQR